MNKNDVLSRNIWDFHNPGYVVIPTNVGWKTNGENVMGRGIALEAKARCPNIAMEYGLWCREHGSKMFVSDDMRLICLPSKPLNIQHPNMSWRDRSDEGICRQSYEQLLTYALNNGTIYIYCPLLGGGNGGLGSGKALYIASCFNWPKNVIFCDKGI